MPEYGRWLRAGTAVTAAAALGAAMLGPAAASAAPPEGPVHGLNAPGVIKDRYIVVFKEGTEAARRAAALAPAYAARVGGQVSQSYHSAVHGFSARLTEQAARRLAADPAVASVEADRTVRLAETQSNPPSWGLDRIDQRTLPLSASYTFTAAANVTAYVIDTGIRTTHTAFGGRARSGWDFVNNDADATDCHGHGTHVAGTIGGSSYGVARNVKLVAVRVLNCSGSGSYSQVIAGIDWVTANAAKPAVVNMSLGGPAFSTLDAAIQRSVAAGITYAVAAGNEASDACTVSPARVPEAITVGASDTADTRASFSNTGTCLDLFAPGVGITSAWSSSDTATNRISGTSMASPHVAGAAAMVLQAHPTWTPAQVREALVANATTAAITSPGTGSPNRLLYTGPTTTAPATCPTVTVSTPVRVPNGTTVTSSAAVTCTGTASATTAVNVTVELPANTGTTLELLGPAGQVLRLRSFAADPVATTVTASSVVNASAMQRTGTWKLRLRGTAPAAATSAGTLRTWSLAL